MFVFIPNHSLPFFIYARCLYPFPTIVQNWTKLGSLPGQVDLKKAKTWTIFFFFKEQLIDIEK